MTALLAQTTAIVFGAAVLRGLTGFGFALAAVPLLNLAMAPAQAVPLSLLVVALGGLFGTRKAVMICDWPSLRGLAIGVAVGSPVGAIVLKHISADAARLAIAGFILAALIGIARNPAPVARKGGAREIGYGLLAGLFNGVAAMPGPPIVAYYMSSAFSRETIRANLLVIFQFTALIGVASAATLGLIGRETFMMTLAALPAFWIGNYAGGRFFAMGSDAAYRRIVLACLALLAISSAVPAVRGLLQAYAR